MERYDYLEAVKDDVRNYLEENGITVNSENYDCLKGSYMKLRAELQRYYDNESKGGTERRRIMLLLRWDIRKTERQLKALWHSLPLSPEWLTLEQIDAYAKLMNA